MEKYMQLKSLKSKFITWIIGCREKQGLSNGKYTEYADEVLKNKTLLKISQISQESTRVRVSFK